MALIRADEPIPAAAGPTGLAADDMSRSQLPASALADNGVPSLDQHKGKPWWHCPVEHDGLEGRHDQDVAERGADPEALAPTEIRGDRDAWTLMG